jgi:LPPG:FO 2-phospho-L-lactate transferase
MMNIVALAGGVGGAKLVDGISRLEKAPELTVIVNTGDDFSLFGLWISPDLDTVCYNLAGLHNLETGWGRDQESWETWQSIQTLGGPDWFKLGNKDLATHLERTRRLESGSTLSQVTNEFCKAWGVEATVLPMSDDPVPTMVETKQGLLSFQDYYVKLRFEPEVIRFQFQDIEKSRPAPGVLEAIQTADWVLICPSNPWVSIDPILAVPGIRSALETKPVLGVSPIIGGEAVKGPAAKMYRELGIDPSAKAVAIHYQGLLDGFVIDDQDQDLKEEIHAELGDSLSLFSTNIWMKEKEDRVSVAEQIVAMGDSLVKEV